MITLPFAQGTPEWKEARADYFTASEAPAAAGVSKYLSRTDLLRQKATKIADDISPDKQRLFDKGHEAEAAARSIVEGIIGEDLFPVTGMLDVEGLPLLARFDGLTTKIAWRRLSLAGSSLTRIWRNTNTSRSSPPPSPRRPCSFPRCRSKSTVRLP